MTMRHSPIIVRLVAILSAAFAAGPAAAQQVWFAPDSETPDLIEMLQRPELWAQNRSRISVIKFGPQQVRATGKPAENSIDDLVKVGAFEKLAAWHIDVAIEAPAIKPWDCTAVHARQMTIDYIRSVNAVDGKVRYIAMDEPLSAGVRQCHDSFEGVLDKTADYIKQLSKDPGLAAEGLTPEIGDIEAYPFFGAADIEHWIRGLEQRGAKPKFLHLDVNIHRVDVDRSINAPRDLAELNRFLRSENVPFGIILWPGYNPVPSHRAFHDLTVSWARRVHEAIGRPDEVIVQSWVVRGGAACSMSDPACDMTHPHCAASDAAGCGKHTVPLNLPESGAFTLTRTLLDSLRILR
jgi:hypothetical protein